MATIIQQIIAIAVTKASPVTQPRLPSVRAAPGLGNTLIPNLKHKIYKAKVVSQAQSKAKDVLSI